MHRAVVSEKTVVFVELLVIWFSIEQSKCFNFILRLPICFFQKVVMYSKFFKENVSVKLKTLFLFAVCNKMQIKWT